MRLIYICAPYAATPDYTVADNIAGARVLASVVAKSRDALPVLTHTMWEGVLSDDADRERVLAGCCELVTMCDAVLVAPVEPTEGMRREIEAARLAQVPVLSLEEWVARA